MEQIFTKERLEQYQAQYGIPLAILQKLSALSETFPFKTKGQETDQTLELMTLYCQTYQGKDARALEQNILEASLVFIQTRLTNTQEKIR